MTDIPHHPAYTDILARHRRSSFTGWPSLEARCLACRQIWPCDAYTAAYIAITEAQQTSDRPPPLPPANESLMGPKR